MLIFIFIKPDFVYDKKHKSFKKFGIKKHRTIFTLPVCSVLVAIIIYIVVLFIYRLNNKNNNTENIRYIPVQYYQEINKNIL